MAEENEKLFDIRTIERNIGKGHTNRKDVDRHLSKLKDLSDGFEISNSADGGTGTRSETQKSEPSATGKGKK